MINIAICDDESSYQEIIEFKVNQCVTDILKMECNITCFNDLNELKEYIDNGRIDIAFLDIMVNDENSMDWSIKNITNRYTQIIFMTSFPQSAYNISETNCCYYLVKSRITEESLSKALKRAIQNTTKKDPNLTLVKSGNKNFAINFQDILYIETFNNNLTLHLQNDEKIVVYSTLKEYANKMPPNFLRCHKCYMVNMNHVACYEPHKFILSTEKAIPIPPKKYKSVISSYKNYLINLQE